jgi:hypothetical protein
VAFRREPDAATALLSRHSQLALKFERNAVGDSLATIELRQLRAFVVPSLLYELQTFFMSFTPPPSSSATLDDVAVDDGFEQVSVVALYNVWIQLPLNRLCFILGR